MKVYIKPWAEALKCAKKQKNLVDEFNSEFGNQTFILGVSRRVGDWGYIRDAIKETTIVNDVEYTTYTIIHLGAKELIYDACCVEEISPEWLEEHASKFTEEVVTTNNTIDTWDKNLESYETHRFTIYKIMDALHTYFFHVRRISYNGFEETVEDFREIN